MIRVGQVCVQLFQETDNIVRPEGDVRSLGMKSVCCWMQVLKVRACDSSSADEQKAIHNVFIEQQEGNGTWPLLVTGAVG